jgi:ComF family protein
MTGAPFLSALAAKRLFSQDCQLCGARTAESLCRDCGSELPFRIAQGCARCALETPGGKICGSCLSEPPAFDQTVAAFSYAFPLDRLLQSYKFNENLSLGATFAQGLVSAVRRHMAQSGQAPPDRVVPLPLARRRLATRGFNQSALLAEICARELGITYVADGLLKVRDTPPQAGLDRKARLKNVRGAFDCTDSLPGLHIAIVDDVMTTGATLSEAARALKDAGAASISAWVVARADGAVAAPLADDATISF